MIQNSKIKEDDKKTAFLKEKETNTGRVEHKHETNVKVSDIIKNLNAKANPNHKDNVEVHNCKPSQMGSWQREKLERICKSIVLDQKAYMNNEAIPEIGINRKDRKLDCEIEINRKDRKIGYEITDIEENTRNKRNSNNLVDLLIKRYEEKALENKD